MAEFFASSVSSAGWDCGFKARTFSFVSVLAFFWWRDLLWFDYGAHAQCTGALLSEIPTLKEITRSPPGRIIGGFHLRGIHCRD